MRSKAEQFGVKEIFIDDLREEFVRDYVFPMFRRAASIDADSRIFGDAAGDTCIAPLIRGLDNGTNQVVTEIVGVSPTAA